MISINVFAVVESNSSIRLNNSTECVEKFSALLENPAFSRVSI